MVGHLGERNLHRLSCEWFQLQRVKRNWFCESSESGKSHRKPFTEGERQRADEPLRIVHSDLHGKLSLTSLEGAGRLSMIRRTMFGLTR